ncbi:3',5'-cyclic-AMP phosphodiesterase [Methylomagnum sp.]
MGDSSTTVVTTGSAGESRPIRILQLTDFHLLAEGRQTMLGVDTEQSFLDVLAAANGSGPPPDLALLTGDLVQDTEASAYRRLHRHIAKLDYPCYCLPGNHDDFKLIPKFLTGDHIHFQPHIDLGRWQIICLDSTIPHQPYGRLAESQFALLENILGSHPEPFTLVTLHHHPVRSGSRWMDTMLLENADRLLGVLEQYPQVRGVVFGHVHQEMDVWRKGMRLLGTPSTCFQFKPKQADFAIDLIPPGYRWITLQPDGGIETVMERIAKLPEGLNPDSSGY